MTPPPEPVDTFSLLRAKPDDPPNIRALRFAVVGMAAVLVLGFGAVIARIVHLTTRPSPSDTTQPAVTQQAPAALPRTNPLASIALPLPAGAKIISQSVAANRLSVHYTAGSDETIAILDLDSGQVVSTVRITPAKN